MSSTQDSNLYLSTANSLQALSCLSEEGRIYREAAKEVLARPKNRDAGPWEKDLIMSNRTLDDLLKTVNEAREKNKMLSQSKLSLPSRSARAIVGTLSRFEKAITNMAQAKADIAMLIWGPIQFLVCIAGEIFDTLDRLNEIGQRLNHCLRRYKTYTEGYKVTGPLRSSLVDFYAHVIQFSITTSQIYRQRKLKMAIYVFQKSVKAPFEKFLSGLDYLSTVIDKDANAENFQNIKSLRNDSAQPLPNQTTAPSPQEKSNFLVPDLLSRTFSGREDLLRCLNRSLHGKQTEGISRAAIWGLPGIGKTQVALRYEKQHRGIYQHVFFVNATSAETILTSYHGIAHVLCSDEKHNKALDKSGAEIWIQAWLAKYTGWLLIYDNAIEPSVVRRYTPVRGRGHILFTTRNEIAAEALVDREEAYEVLALPPPQAISFVLLLQKIVAPTDEETRLADRLIRTVRGLPIAIEQAVLLARLRKISLFQIMPDIERRKTLLEQSHPASMHEHECSMGALVSMTLDTLAADSPQGASLFRLLVYFNTSSIPIELLTNASSELEYHFSRRETYNRGLIPIANETNQTQVMGIGDRTPYKWRSFGKKFWKSTFPFPSKLDSTALPRVDSNADKAVEAFFRNDRLLQDVLEKETRIENALIDIKKAGLIRRPNDKTVWIHDLFAQLTIAVLEEKSQSTSRDTAHLVLLIVYLSFPVPDFASPRNIRDLRSACVPHAFSILTHCAPFYRQLTMAPELAHLTASAINLTGYKNTSPEYRENLVKYYQMAAFGYHSAWGRLLNHPSITHKDVLLHTRQEYDLEDSKCLRNLFTLYCYGYQRFGSTAASRAVQTSMKLGTIYKEVENYPEALRWTVMAVKGFRGLYGDVHCETMESRAVLLSIYKDMNYWDQGYVLGRLMVQKHMERFGGGLMSAPGAQIASDVGDCAMGLRDTEDAIFWYGFSLRAFINEYGDNDRGLSIISAKLATVEGLQHAHGRSLRLAQRRLEIYKDPKLFRPYSYHISPSTLVDLEVVIALQQFELGNAEAATSGCERALGLCCWNAEFDHARYASYRSVWDSGLQAVWVWGCIEFDGDSKPDEWSVPNLRVTEELTRQALVKYGPLRGPCCGKKYGSEGWNPGGGFQKEIQQSIRELEEIKLRTISTPPVL